MITAKQLVDYAKRLRAGGAGYWYGTFGVKASTSLYNSKRKQYAAHYTSSRAARYKADIKAGRTVTDCVGLVKGAAWSDCGAHAPKYETGGCPDKSANGMFDWCRSKGMRNGKMASMPELPGLFLHKDAHCGVYIGDGWAIEARGFDFGVVKTKVKDRGWTGWAMLPFVEYHVQDVPAEPDVPADGDGEVLITGGTVNVRTKPDTNGAILGIARKGERYGYTGETAVNGWHGIRFGTRDAWVSGLYSKLTKSTADPSTDDPQQPPSPPTRTPVIVDISQHNGLKAKGNDWTRIAKEVDLLIIRCGVTRTETKPLGIGIDAEFSYAMKMCAKYGIPFGVYYYGKVKSTEDARKEARKAWSTASPYMPLFYAYDVEEARLSNAMVEAWMDEIRRLGAKKVGLYIAHHMYTKFSVAAKKADFVWVPRYGKNTGFYEPKYVPAYKCDLHQYTSVGRVPGFADKTLDLNRLTGTKELSWFLAK